MYFKREDTKSSFFTSSETNRKKLYMRLIHVHQLNFTVCRMKYISCNCNGVFTLPDTETDTEKNGLHKIVCRCSYCVHTRDRCKFPLGTVHILSVSVSVRVMFKCSFCTETDAIMDLHWVRVICLCGSRSESVLVTVWTYHNDVPI